MQANLPDGQLSPEEAQMAITFLNRVDLKGSEAEAMAILKAKLRQIMKPPQDRDQQRENGEGGNVHELTGATGEGSALA